MVQNTITTPLNTIGLNCVRTTHRAREVANETDQATIAQMTEDVLLRLNALTESTW